MIPEAPRSPTPNARDAAVRLWLFVCVALVFAMVVVGGVTRLTRSGLSIVEWKPLLGALPPLGEAAWAAEFARYQTSPEYQLVNRGMSLSDFQSIYWVEWAHRLLGRLTGLVAFVPLVYFAIRRRISASLVKRLAVIIAIGGLQGFVGWWMVASGLVREPRVSHFRLATHLLLALALFTALLATALDTVSPGVDAATWSDRHRRLRAISFLGTLWLTLTLAWGAFTAGLHAGLVCPTFPDVYGGIVGPAFGAGAPGSFVLEPLTVQTTHRLLAYGTALLAVLAWWRGRGLDAVSPITRSALRALPWFVALQIALGALTVIYHVPLVLAAVHQANAVLVLAALVAVVHGVRRVG